MSATSALDGLPTNALTDKSWQRCPPGSQQKFSHEVVKTDDSLAGGSILARRCSGLKRWFSVAASQAGKPDVQAFQRRTTIMFSTEVIP